MGFRIPWAVFRFPKPRIWIQQANISRILDPDSHWLVPSRHSLSLPSGARVGPSGDIEGSHWPDFSSKKRLRREPNWQGRHFLMYYVKLSKRKHSLIMLSKYTFFLDNIVEFFSKKIPIKTLRQKDKYSTKKNWNKELDAITLLPFRPLFPIGPSSPSPPCKQTMSQITV